MRFHHSVLAASVIAGLAGSSGAYAQSHASHASGTRAFNEILRTVQLSPVQQGQVHQITRAARSQQAPLHARIGVLRHQIEAILFSTGPVTAAQIMPLQQQIESLRQQADADRLQTELALRDVLTSEQLATASRVQGRLASLHQQEHAILAASSR